MLVSGARGRPIVALQAAFAITLAASTGCSVRKYAIKKLGDALAKSGSTLPEPEKIPLLRLRGELIYDYLR